MILRAFPGEKNPLPLSNIPRNDPKQALADGGCVLRMQICVHDGFLMLTAKFQKQTEEILTARFFGSSEFEEVNWYFSDVLCDF